MRMFMEISVKVFCSNCQWEGQGWWEVVPGKTDWAAVANGVSRCLIGAIGGLVGEQDYRFNLEGQAFELDDVLAAKVDQHTSRYPADDPRQIVWGLKEIKVARRTRTVNNGDKG